METWTVSHRRPDDVLAEGPKSHVLADGTPPRCVRGEAIGVDAIASAAPLLAPELAQRADATPRHNQLPGRGRGGNGLEG